MALKLENGNYVLGPAGVPEETSGLGELLQDALLRLTVPKGSFPYDRELGSCLSRLDREEEHSLERAVSMANEALLGMPGVRAEQAAFVSGGGIRLTLATPLGKGTVVYGNV